ncbi:MAG: IgGFc-binding protein [bacterium]|nr:IgGFc-binding protein [Candidatus Kapabacteria bacterium]
MLRRFISPIIAVAGLLLATDVAAQGVAAQGVNTWGREFWVTFLPNFGAGSGSEIPGLRVSLRARRLTRVVITSTRNGESLTVMAGSESATLVRLEETFGADSDLSPADSNVGRKSFHIVADDDITVAAASIKAYSADAMLVLPVKLFGTKYIALSYPNGTGTTEQQVYDMCSQYAIVANDNNTNLEITPSYGPKSGQRYSLKLHRGDVYLAMAPLGTAQDVSGTEIRSDKPVAVFAGHRRTSVPVTIGNYRDHLLEQMPPTDAWSDEGLAVPLYPITPQSPDTSVLRIVTADSGTISVNGSSYHMPGRAPIEFPLPEPMVISSTVPILAGVVEHSVHLMEGGSQPLPGDPSIILVVPSRDFDTGYSFESFNHSEFSDHFITIVSRADERAPIMLDGRRVTERFVRVDDSDYSYAYVRMQAGSHTINSTDPFGVYVYGFGGATSYAYPAGFVRGGSISSVSRQVDIASATHVLPNPASSAVAIIIGRPIVGDARVSLVSASGIDIPRESSSGRSGSLSTRIAFDVSDIAPGSYACRVTLTDGTVLTQTLVVVR